ncbi:MAG: glycosyltransferase family 9 protein [Ignavibacteriales bacterium]|nr:glycosyltransferase family 9 protein [Ignavibacteriales bacterium]
MSLKDNFRKIVIKLSEKFLAVQEYSDRSLGNPINILVIRQHNQFGDMLASVSLFRAIKETYPHCRITLIASPENYYAVDKNKYIDEIFVFKNNKLLFPNYAYRLKKILRHDWDIAIVPVTVAVSLTSCILTGLAKAKVKIGPEELNGGKNNLAFVFNHRIKLDWRKCPDAHVSDFILDIVRPFGIRTKNYSTSVFFDETDIKTANQFIESLLPKDDCPLIGFHIGAGKPRNRWPLEKYVELIERIKTKINAKIYFTGSDADRDALEFIKKRCCNESGYFLNKSIPQLAALISLSNFFITNDTGVMHVAGATATPQISIFGPTNPFNWAPVGPTKYFLRKSELISDVSVDSVFDLFNYLLEKQRNEKH